MSSHPAVSGKEAVRALQRLGFRLDRIEGSHHMLVKDDHPHTVVVPRSWFAAIAKGHSREHHSQFPRSQKGVPGGHSMKTQ